MIHRGLEPKNVVVVDREADDGTPIEVVKVLDFGVAKMNAPIAGAPRHVTIEMVSGTPEYMSPEQCDGRALDARSDLYACGCVLYFLATSEPPFVGGALLDVLLKHSREEPKPLTHHQPGFPPALEAVILGLLAKRPNDRPRSARHLGAALRAIDLIPTRDDIPIDVDDMQVSSTDIDIRRIKESMEVEMHDSALGARSERLRKTVIIPRDVDAIAKRPRVSATRLMAAAIALAIVVGVVVGLFFGQLYSPEPAEPTTDQGP